MISYEEAHRIWKYDEITGHFFWKIRPAMCRRIGDRADHSCGPDDPYFNLYYMRRKYLAHRVAWLMSNGTWPGYVDHKDKNGKNNAKNNLRECSRSENNFNRGLQRNNRSGFKGVSWHKHDRAWKAQLYVGGKKVFEKSFKTPEEAHAAYCREASKHHGEFARHG